MDQTPYKSILIFNGEYNMSMYLASKPGLKAQIVFDFDRNVFLVTNGLENYRGDIKRAAQFATRPPHVVNSHRIIVIQTAARPRTPHAIERELDRRAKRRPSAPGYISPESERRLMDHLNTLYTNTDGGELFNDKTATCPMLPRSNFFNALVNINAIARPSF
jgi:hypothetical protein